MKDAHVLTAERLGLDDPALSGEVVPFVVIDFGLGVNKVFVGAEVEKVLLLLLLLLLVRGLVFVRIVASETEAECVCVEDAV